MIMGALLLLVYSAITKGVKHAVVPVNDASACTFLRKQYSVYSLYLK